jgi:hypothetical protein
MNGHPHARRRRAVATLVAASVTGVLLLSACGAARAGDGGSSRRSGAIAVDCAGTPLLLVRNESGTSVTILEVNHLNRATAHLATVPPGSHEFTVRGEKDYEYRVVAPPGSTSETMRTVRRGNAVRLERRCVQPGQAQAG